VTTQQIIELVLAVAIFAAGVWLYRRRHPGGYGSQSAVLLFALAALLLIHGLGLLGYRPSPSELGQ
jgi:hypothetical protein